MNGKLVVAPVKLPILRRQVESDSLSVVVPVYNEEENIAALLEQLQAAIKDWAGEVEFLFVDDGSNDSTLELSQECAVERSTHSHCPFSPQLGTNRSHGSGLSFGQGPRRGYARW